ncbi:MAG: hypothetical protein R3C49_08065 [Planctomycetaceae bacterium]
MPQAAFSAYRKASHTGLTRIDMLVRLYESTLRTLKDGLAALQCSDHEQFQVEQSLATQYMLAILDGIDPENGEVAFNSHRLNVYVTGLLMQGTVDSWQSAIRLLQPLADSFAAIRDEAAALELSGEIPALDFRTVYEHSTL